MASRQDKLKLTETGAAALRDWLRRRGWTLERLAQAAGLPHAMASSRAIKRQGGLTLEQIAKIVSLAGGELTAAQLVGLELAAAVPVLPVAPPPPRAAPPAVRASPAASPHPAEPADGDDQADGAAPKDLGDRYLEAAYPAAAMTLARAASGGDREGEPPPTPSQIRSALAVVEFVGGKARQREETQREVEHAPEEQLMKKLRFVYSQLTGKTVAAVEAEERGEFSGEGLA